MKMKDYLVYSKQDKLCNVEVLIQNTQYQTKQVNGINHKNKQVNCDV